MTIYANAGHVYMDVAGIRFDTSNSRVTGSRWSNEMRSTGGFVARHPAGPVARLGCAPHEGSCGGRR